MSGNLPRATHRGTLKIGDINIPVAVLDNGKRVISETGLTRAMWGDRSGASKRIKYASQEAGAPIPVFLAPGNLRPYISQDMLDGPLLPLEYEDGKRIVNGYEATLLPILCDIWLKARDDGNLKPGQADKVRKADILMRGLATVGIIAFVDEVTGYQYDRARQALEEILDKFISKELRKWAKTFPDEFYKEMFRLKGWPFTPWSIKRPGVVGRYTNDLVYERLAPGVLEELRIKNPPNQKGHRKHRHFQWRTEDVGHPRLREHLTAVMALMRASANWDKFYRSLQRAFPKYNTTLELPFSGYGDNNDK